MDHRTATTEREKALEMRDARETERVSDFVAGTDVIELRLRWDERLPEEAWQRWQFRSFQGTIRGNSDPIFRTSALEATSVGSSGANSISAKANFSYESSVLGKGAIYKRMKSLLMSAISRRLAW